MPKPTQRFKPADNPVALMRHNVEIWREMGEPDSWIRCRVPKKCWEELGLGTPPPDPKVGQRERRSSRNGLTTSQVAANAKAIIEAAYDAEEFKGYTQISREAGGPPGWLKGNLDKELPWAIQLAAAADELCQYGNPDDYLGNQCPKNLREYWERQNSRIRFQHRRRSA